LLRLIDRVIERAQLILPLLEEKNKTAKTLYEKGSGTRPPVKYGGQVSRWSAWAWNGCPGSANGTQMTELTGSAGRWPTPGKADTE
jgi:hypothetical protein